MLIGTHVETSYSVVGRDGLQHLEPGQFYNGKKISHLPVPSTPADM